MAHTPTIDRNFIRPSFLEGMGRLFDLAGSLRDYHTTRTPEEADAMAIRNDFQVVGSDVRSALEQTRQTSR